MLVGRAEDWILSIRLMDASRGDDDFDMTWAERLWSRNHKGVGVMDFVLLGASAENGHKLKAKASQPGTP